MEREPVKEPKGYALGRGQHIQDILAVEAELLRTEGIDPTWPRFPVEPETRAQLDSP